jgi:hypothetical protein
MIRAAHSRALLRVWHELLSKSEHDALKKIGQDLAPLISKADAAAGKGAISERGALGCKEVRSPEQPGPAHTDSGAWHLAPQTSPPSPLSLKGEGVSCSHVLGRRSLAQPA